MYKFVLTWHKTLKEKGLDILEDHGLELFCQVLTRSGDFCIAKRKERSLFLDCRYKTLKKLSDLQFNIYEERRKEKIKTDYM